MSRQLEVACLLDCPECGTTFDHVFVVEGLEERQEIVEAPTATVECPGCQHTFEAEWQGWTAHEDAG